MPFARVGEALEVVPGLIGLGTPDVPAIRFVRGTVFGATLVRNCYGLSGCWPPVRI